MINATVTSAVVAPTGKGRQRIVISIFFSPVPPASINCFTARLERVCASLTQRQSATDAL